MKERRKKHKEEFLSLLKDCVWMEAEENVDLERVFGAFDEDPEIFQKNWLRPLLAAPVKSSLKVSFVRTRSDLSNRLQSWDEKRVVLLSRSARSRSGFSCART